MAPEEVLSVLDRPQVSRWEHKAVPTGSLGLDIALGGGWPAGRISELYGLSGSGKSLVAYHAAARAQETGTVAWIDTGEFNKTRAQHAGVDLDRLPIGRLSHADQAVWAVRDAIAANASLVVLDTASGLDVPDVDYAEEIGALQRACWQSETAVLVTNNRYPGRSSGRFVGIIRAVSSVRVGLTREALLFRANVTKNQRVVPHEHQIRFKLYRGHIDECHEAVALGLDTGVLHTRGSWVCYQDVALGQGVLNAANFIRSKRIALQIQEAVANCLA